MGYKEKETQKAYNKIYNAENKARRAAYAREYYLRNRDAIREKALHYKKSDQGRTTILQRTFGITSQQYNTLLDLQEHCCRLCGAPDMSSGMSLAVDHDHKTGKVRKLLCGKCNRGIGYFNDDPDLVARVEVYLRVHGK